MTKRVAYRLVAKDNIPNVVNQPILCVYEGTKTSCIKRFIPMATSMALSGHKVFIELVVYEDK